MKKILLTTGMLLGTSLFIGCGSSSSSDNGATTSISSLKSEISKLPTQPGQIEHNNASNASNARTKMQQKLQKAKKEGRSIEKGEDIESCSKSGTMETIVYSDAIDFVFDKCIEEKLYQNGTYTYYFQNEAGFTIETYLNYTIIGDIIDNPTDKITIKELTFTDNYSYNENEVNREIDYIHGDMTSSLDGKIVESLEYTNFTFVEDKKAKSFYLDGTFKTESKCYTSTDTYKMDDDPTTWLVDHDTNSDYSKSGTITINGLKYVFDDTNVILSKNGKTETITQDEMIAALEGEGEGDCSISKAIKKPIF